VTSPDPTRYASSLSFLLLQVRAHSTQAFAEPLRPLGVTPRAVGLMSNLAGGGDHTQQSLADFLGIHRNIMVGLVDALERVDWVRRERSRRDRRAFEIRLTPAGSKIVTQVNELIDDIDDEVAAGLSGAERRALSTLLVTLAQEASLVPGVHPYLRGGLAP
jgi:DNA-binding MarR family transcriptional regulator